MSKLSKTSLVKVYPRKNIPLFMFSGIKIKLRNLSKLIKLTMSDNSKRFMGDNLKIIFDGCDIWKFQVSLKYWFKMSNLIISQSCRKFLLNHLQITQYYLNYRSVLTTNSSPTQKMIFGTRITFECHIQQTPNMKRSMNMELKA